MKEKIIFFGSSDYCIPILEIINNTFHLSAIITKKGQAVEKFALSHNIKVFTPEDKNELSNLKNEISQSSLDLAIVADYGLIIPPEIFTIPLYKTLNIHFSKLPALRGPSPVQYTILAGEKTAWITIIVMDKEMDTGDVIWQKEISLTSDKSTNYPINQLSNQPIKETTGSLYKKLFVIASTSLPAVINKYVKNEIKPHKQNHSMATYTRHLTREDGFIPSNLLEMAIKGIEPTKDQLSKWNTFNNVLSILPTADCRLPMFIDRTLRAFSPWPGLWTEITLPNNNPMTNPRDRLHLSSNIKKRLKILEAYLEPTTHNSQSITRFVPDLVQLEGKKPVSWKQFLAGYPHFYF